MFLIEKYVSEPIRKHLHNLELSPRDAKMHLRFTDIKLGFSPLRWQESQVSISVTNNTFNITVLPNANIPIPLLQSCAAKAQEHKHNGFQSCI